ncbi:hypothetical protein [Streptomyces roseicoloratus]|uniref:Lipoprotein n=1 Tax=Streptomyces roseicoloratus TaxID=2508722 RepID=A0ABY9S117_9ACTN|nr:hypothetical protein [Streptomyces roseicoloratus]WMX48108.1 hypothetical protein RGF97_29435 [Streptomyces roseicoloratus]
MHKTRTTVTLLAGVAMAALSGCMAVEPPSPSPVPAPGGPAAVPAAPARQDVAPQIVQGPAREALEAAMPDPPESEARSSVERRRNEDGQARARPRRAEPSRSSAAPKKQKPRHPVAEPPGVPRMPRDRAEVCALGQAYGGWSADSPQAKLCRGHHGH